MNWIIFGVFMAIPVVLVICHVIEMRAIRESARLKRQALDDLMRDLEKKP